MKKSRRIIRAGFIFLFAICLGIIMTGCSKTGKSNGSMQQEINLKDCRIVYDKSDFMSKRYAYLLYTEVEALTGVQMTYSDIKADSEDDSPQIRIMETSDEDVANGKAQILTDGSTVTVRIGSYYGFEAVLDYIRSVYEEKGDCIFPYKFEWTGTYLDGLAEEEASNAYAYSRGGDYRFMFYNVLFEADTAISNDKADQRNYLQSQMIAQYMPDVVGMQERDKTKAEWAGDYDFVTLLAELGYAQVEVEVENSMEINYTPIFYRTDRMTPLESGYLNYENQDSDSWEHDISSKSMTWCVFESVEGDQFLMVSTHLCVDVDDVRVAQIKEALEVVNQLVEKYNVPVIFGGDFNTKMTSNCYSYCVTEGGFIDAAQNAADFKSSVCTFFRPYPTYIISDNLDFNGMYPPTGIELEKDFGTSVDHILLKNGEKVDLKVYGVVVDNCTLSSSDHFPTFIDFSVNK